MGTHVPKKAHAQMINASEIPRADAKMSVSLAGTARTNYTEERERVSCAQGVETILRYCAQPARHVLRPFIVICLCTPSNYQILSPEALLTLTTLSSALLCVLLWAWCD